MTDDRDKPFRIYDLETQIPIEMHPRVQECLVFQRNRIATLEARLREVAAEKRASRELSYEPENIGRPSLDVLADWWRAQRSEIEGRGGIPDLIFRAIGEDGTAWEFDADEIVAAVDALRQTGPAEYLRQQAELDRLRAEAAELWAGGHGGATCADDGERDGRCVCCGKPNPYR